MREADAAYISGFFDGEGCVHLSTRRGWAEVRISIGQKDPATLMWIMGLFGFGRIEERKNGSHVYRIDRNEDKLEFIRVVFPYAQLKRNRLKLAYHILKTSNGWGKRMTPDQRKRRERLADRWQ